MTRDDEPGRRVPQRGDDGNLPRQALIGVGWVALVSALLTVMGALLAVLVSLGY